MTPFTPSLRSLALALLVIAALWFVASILAWCIAGGEADDRAELTTRKR